MDYFDGLKAQLGLEPFKANTYSPLALAYIGDSIYDIVIRTMILNRGGKAVGKIHKEVSSYVNAGAQAEIFYRIEPELTEEEMAVFKRGRNAKSGSIPKNSSMKTYKHATGFEAVLGYLYLQEDLERIFELIRIGLTETPEKNEKEGKDVQR